MSERKPIRIVVVDDHPMVREGIAATLLAVDDIALVGTAADGDEAVKVCEKVHPDAVLNRPCNSLGWMASPPLASYIAASQRLRCSS